MSVVAGAGAPALAGAAGPAASFTVSPSPAYAGETVTFQSTSQGSKLQESWDLDGNGKYGDAFGPTASATFDTRGKHTVGLMVTDSNALTDEHREDVEVIKRAPFAVSSNAPKVGDHVVFDGSALGQGHGGVKDYRWDLDGDGVFERDTRLAPAVGVTYGKGGTYEPALIVTFADGTASTFDGTMTVGDGAAAPDCGVYCHVDFPFHAPGVAGGGGGCQTSLEFGLIVAESDCFLAGGGGTYTSAGRVRVNGLDVVPSLGTSITIDPEHFAITSPAPAAIQFGELPLALVPVNWTGLDGTDGAAATPNYLAPPGSDLIEGFQQAGRQEIVFHSHTATFNTEVSLPETTFGGVDAGLRLGVDSDHPATIDELHVNVPAGSLQGALPLHNIVLDYNAAGNSWGGSAGVDIGDYSVDAGIGFHLEPSFGLDRLNASIGGLNVPVSSGVFLDAIRFGYGTVPDPDHPGSTFSTIGGGITLTYGGTYAGRNLVAADGDFVVTFSHPAAIDLTGEGRILGQKIAAIAARYSFDGNFTFEANLRIGLNAFPPSPRNPPYWEDGEPVPPVRIEGRVDGFVDGPRGTFNAQGSGQACLNVVGCLGGRVVMSSRGTAGCAFIGGAGVGVGYDWRTGVVTFIGGACDLSGWSEVRASAVNSAVERDIDLPAGLPVAAFRVKGDGGPPSITVTGPKGERISSAASATSFVTQAGDETYAVVAGPAAGTWKITANPGSPPIVSATEARGLPPVSVKARVTGRGRARALEYSVGALKGQTVTFAEQTGRLGHALGTAKGTRGTLRFKPGEGPGGRRTIVATVSQSGLPRKQLVVATYVAPGPLRPGRPPRLSLRRKDGTLLIGWAPASGGPRFYRVLVTSVNRRRLLYELPAKRRSVTVPRFAPGDKATVTVWGLTRTRQVGAGATAVAKKGG
jgi:PKD repeat protein